MRQRHMDEKNPPPNAYGCFPKAMVMTPTRELAIQVCSWIKNVIHSSFLDSGRSEEVCLPSPSQSLHRLWLQLSPRTSIYFGFSVYGMIVYYLQIYVYREREIQRDRQTDRHTDRQTHTQEKVLRVPTDKPTKLARAL